MGYRVWTKNGFDFYEVSGLLQKSIRRGDYKLAGAAANELFPKYRNYIWKRLLIVSAEDCGGIITKEIIGLKLAQDEVMKQKDPGRIFISKAICLLCQCIKNRDAAYFGCNFFHDANLVNPDDIRELNIEDLKMPVEIPDWVLDVHTLRGKRSGKTIWDMILQEQKALKPLQKGLFDDDTEWAGYRERIKVLGK